MKKLVVSLISAMVLVFISVKCCGPSLVYKGEIQHRDTIQIVTQPGFYYQVSVIPNLSNLNKEQIKNFKPLIYTREGVVSTALADEDGGSYIFGSDKPMQDTVHIITVFQPDGKKYTITCFEEDGTVPIQCGDSVYYVPCKADSTYNCDDL